jgi:hypothetical protein
VSTSISTSVHAALIGKPVDRLGALESLLEDEARVDAGAPFFLEAHLRREIHAIVVGHLHDLAPDRLGRAARHVGAPPFLVVPEVDVVLLAPRGAVHFE